MKIVSVNVGLPREVVWKGITVQTAIFKEPVAGTVAIRKLNLAGDLQADLTVHGGWEKAVYAYPAEHYDYWREQLSGSLLSWGAFGENLTTAGLWEDEQCIGDLFPPGSPQTTHLDSPICSSDRLRLLPGAPIESGAEAETICASLT
jgi:MOSC domain-containing protein YiiM